MQWKSPNLFYIIKIGDICYKVMWCKTDLERKHKELHYISATVSDALARNNKTLLHAMPNTETKLCGK